MKMCCFIEMADLVSTYLFLSVSPKVTVVEIRATPKLGGATYKSV